MTEIEYISPICQVEIGDYQLSRVTNLEIVSSRLNPFDVATIDIDCFGVTTSDFQVGNEVIVGTGYRENGVWNTFVGTVVDASKKRVVRVFAKDRMLSLTKQRITKTFVDATPQEILGYGLRLADVGRYQLSSRHLPKRHLFVANNITVVDLIKLVNRTWGLDDWSFYFEPDGLFYWGPWEESDRYKQDEVLVFEFGKNIFDLVPSDEETGTLTTILLPELRHSMRIRIKDNRFWQQTFEARIERIIYRFEQFKARTYIEWRIKKS